jgi:hypothetical protein
LPLVRCALKWRSEHGKHQVVTLAGANQESIGGFQSIWSAPDGAALIEYLKSANKEHKKICDQLSSHGNTDPPNSPLLYRRTHDMLECQRVRLRLL